ncbi:VWA domain-containing protein [Kroppenstedtia pulmonis]|uniref:VWA domain-containing protein n=1 Tax=Kroppenstedtia pulmonis TaxID=1380685 RepID=A0A7D4C494_9BACL|nr:VWA domain-containing protein [Kroppenstedtia pulmonis]QKG83176.1 VWA domain-containing protein [Kroppenstedtia pulmonis]
MTLRKVLIPVLFILSLFLSGCMSYGESESKKEESFQAATDIEGILKEQPGVYGGKNFDPEQVKEEMDKLPDGVSAKEAYNRLVELMGEDYKEVDQKIQAFDPSYRVGGLNQEEGGGDRKKGEKKARRVHMEILLDASGSMAGKVDGKVKMDQAKQAIQSFVSGMPEHVQVSLRVYGHRGSNAKKDKEISCAETEQVYPMDSYNEMRFNTALNKFKPTGWTPLAKAMQEARRDLQSNAGDGVHNVVYIVSDGVETCGGDPIREAQELHLSEIEAVVNIIGFDLDKKEEQALKQVAKAGGGSYRTARNGSDMNEILRENQRKTRNIVRSVAYRNNHAVGMTRHRMNMMDQIGKLVSENGAKRGLLVIRYQREAQRLKKAVAYLSRQGKISSSEREKLDRKIEKRIEELKNYRQDQAKEMSDQLKQSLKKANEEIKENAGG